MPVRPLTKRGIELRGKVASCDGALTLQPASAAFISVRFRLFSWFSVSRFRSFAAAAEMASCALSWQIRSTLPLLLLNRPPFSGVMSA